MGRPWFAMLLVLAVFGTTAASSAPAEPQPPAAGADIRDIRGPLPSRGLPPFALTGTVLLVAGGVAIARRKMRRKEAPLPSPAVAAGSDPAEALEKLAADYRRGACPAETLCLSLAALVRSALTEWTGLPANLLTTGELLDRAAAPGMPFSGKLPLAGRILSFCDLVKFAGHHPEAAEAERALEAARELLGRSSKEERHEVS